MSRFYRNRKKTLEKQPGELRHTEMKSQDENLQDTRSCGM